MELFKNAKFIVINAVILIILCIALISGDGKKMVLNFYEKLTGQQFETFSPITMKEYPTYLLLKYKLLRDHNVEIENVDVTIFKESETSHKYRVVLNKGIFFYKIQKKPDGVWQTTVTQEE